MIYIASVLTYYEGETIIGVFSTLRRAQNAIKREKKRMDYSDEMVVYAMPLDVDAINWKNTVWSNKKGKTFHA